SSFVSGRCLCFAFRPAGRATSSGLAREIGCPGGAPGLRMLSKIGRASRRFDFGGELLLSIIGLHSVCSDRRDAIATQTRCQTFPPLKTRAREGFHRLALEFLKCDRCDKWCLGFATPR